MLRLICAFKVQKEKHSLSYFRKTHSGAVLLRLRRTPVVRLSPMHGQADGENGAEAHARKASNRIPEGALGRTLHCAPAISSSPEISRPAAIGAAGKTKREYER